MRTSKLLLIPWALFALHGVHAHGDHERGAQAVEDWATYHMSEEHHIDNFDPGSFFSLHDFNSDDVWTPNEVRRLYGFDDESNKDTSEARKESAVRDVFTLYDPDRTGQITRDAWLHWTRAGRKLPDFGLGPGHHGDDEYEYEIHHFEKFHDENTKEEDLIHPEDIAHFKKHDQMDDEDDRLAILEQMAIVDANIPQKFRKQQ